MPTEASLFLLTAKRDITFAMQRWGRGFWFSLGSLAFAQAPSDNVFRSTTKLVQVSVIAQDKKALPVADLRREEFQILDNGAPQEIRLFLSEPGDSQTATPLP